MAEKEKKSLYVDQSFRRTWDKDAARKKATEKAGGAGELVEKVVEELGRAQKKSEDAEAAEDLREKRRRDREEAEARAPLVRRQYKVDLESRLGKSQVLQAGTPITMQGGYYCDICDCTLKDSATYLDHINGKKHHRALGMNMRLDRDGKSMKVDGVREVLARKKEDAEKKSAHKRYDDDKEVARIRREFEERRKKRRLQDADLVAAGPAGGHKRTRSKSNKPDAGDEEGQPTAVSDAADGDMMTLMGFGGFSTSKAPGGH